VGSLVIWAVGTATITGLGLPAADHALFDPTDDANPSLLLLLVPLVLFVNGPVEELLYRNVVQKYLAERFNTLTAVGIASVIFALAHLPAYFTANPAGIVVTLGLLFVVSCLWGALYAHTRSLVVVSAIHGLYNAVLLGMVYATTV
jgi:membrane protease YdiL (CAAX protease family)